jgi:hypothetical protein
MTTDSGSKPDRAETGTGSVHESHGAAGSRQTPSSISPPTADERVALLKRLGELRDHIENGEQSARYLARLELAGRLPDIIAAMSSADRRVLRLIADADEEQERAELATLNTVAPASEVGSGSDLQIWAFLHAFGIPAADALPTFRRVKAALVAPAPVSEVAAAYERGQLDMLERAKQAARYVPVGDGYFDPYASHIEAVDALKPQVLSSPSSEGEGQA